MDCEGEMITIKIDPETANKYKRPRDKMGRIVPLVYPKRGPYSKKYLFKCVCGCERVGEGNKKRKYFSHACIVKDWKKRNKK